MTDKVREWIKAMRNYKLRLPPGFWLVHSKEEADRIVDKIRRSPPPQSCGYEV